MPFREQPVQVINELKIALPTIIGTLIKISLEDPRWKIEVHIPGRNFGKTTEPIDFHFIAPTWLLDRNVAAHCALGRIHEEYNEELFALDLTMVSAEDQMEKSSAQGVMTPSSPTSKTWRCISGPCSGRCTEA